MNEAQTDLSLKVLEAFTLQLHSSSAVTGSTVLGLDVGTLLENMSMTVIIVSIIAGLIGSGYFMFGKRNLNIPMMTSGILLCVVPYFINNNWILIIACSIMLAAPFIVERYV